MLVVVGGVGVFGQVIQIVVDVLLHERCFENRFGRIRYLHLVTNFSPIVTYRGSLSIFCPLVSSPTPSRRSRHLTLLQIWSL